MSPLPLYWKLLIFIAKSTHFDIVQSPSKTLFQKVYIKFLSMLSYVAEQERKKTKQRQAEGIEVAQKKGVKFGRPKREITKDFVSVYDEWKSGVITAVQAMQKVGMKPNTFYRRVSEYENVKASS